jgi:hypothetical protein
MWFFLLACRPYTAPPEPPALVAAQAVRVEAAKARRLAVRAGSAFDPPGREGLAWVAARIAASRIDAEVTVGREIVDLELRGGTDAVGRIWDPITDAEVAAAARMPVRSCLGQAEDAYAAWAWAGHPYGHPVWGRSSTLSTIRAVEVEQFLARWWVRAAIQASEEMPALSRAAPRLVRAPVPHFAPEPPVEPILRVRGVGTCAAVSGTGHVDAAPVWSLLTTSALPAHSEGLYAATIPLPDGAAGERRLLDELTAWADGAPPPVEAATAPWGRSLLPADGPGVPTRLDAATTLARWMGSGRLRMVVVVPDDAAPEAPSVADLVR